VIPGDPNAGPAEPELPAASLAHLGQARRWARLVATFGFVGAAFLLLGTAGMAAVPANPKFPKGVLVACFLGGTAAVCVFGGLLWGYSGALRSFAAGRPRELVVAFRRLRIYWMLLAIASALSILVALGFIGLALSGVVPMR
jgi:hypothetical protein